MRYTPPPPKRSYEDYEKLEPEFAKAMASIDLGNYEQAGNALDCLCKQAMMMWSPPFGFQVSDLLKLKDDVENGRTAPPSGDFVRRLDEAHEYFKSEYEKDRARSELRSESRPGRQARPAVFSHLAGCFRWRSRPWSGTIVTVA